MNQSIQRLFVIAIILILTPLAFGQHKLTLEFKGMTPHVGQQLEIRVLDTADGREVGQARVDSIPGAEFSVDLYVLKDGHSYQIDFYADHNGNGQYDPPSTDHAWRLELDDADGDETLTFTHNTTFTDIQWSFQYDIVQYAGTWNGRWRNLTYSTTDSLVLVFDVDEDSQTVAGSLTTAGAFGNPETVTLAFEGRYETDSDTVRLTPPAPWTGEVIFVNGEISGSISDPNLFSVGLTLDVVGTYGLTQFIVNYTMTGAFQANGVLWANKSIETGVETAPGAPPADFVLYQNHPNPFNPTTTIRYQLVTPAEVSLTVYSIDGQQIRTLVNTRQPAGTHAITWNGRDHNGQRVASGVYLYRLQAGEQVLTRRMMMVK
jgi:hypothetical protein